MQFLNPDVFYIMLIPLLLLIVLILTSKQNMNLHFSKEILNKLAVGGKTIDKTTRNALFFITLIFFIIALARPVIDKKEQDIKQNLIPIVVALDVSKSMMAIDIFPNRIALAKQKLKKIIELSQNSTIGVLLFANDSFILSPVTEDFVSLKYIIDNFDTDIDFANGSNIYATLEATSFMLNDFNVKNLIILSDGGNDNKYEKELSFTKEKNINIYSIGLATKNGSAIPIETGGYLTDKNGDIVTVKLNESIKNLSLNSGGGYIDYSLDDSDVKAILNRINEQSAKEDLSNTKIKTYTELFYYPLAFALFVLLLALSSFPSFRKNRTNSLIIALIILPTISKSEIFEFKNIQNAKNYYEKKEFDKASDEYRKISQTPQSMYNLANSLYKEKKYQEAIDTYSKVVTDDKDLEQSKLHNIGNSYVRQNNLEKAKEFYEKALKVKEDKQTKENLDIVNKELEKRKQKDQKKNNKQQNKDNKNNSKKDNKQKNKSDQEKNKQNNQSGKKQNKDNKKDQEKNKNQDKQNDKKDGKSNKDDAKKQENKDNSKDINSIKQSKNFSQKEISDLEEQKWMKMIDNKKSPILLRKANTTKESKNNENKPW